MERFESLLVFLEIKTDASFWKQESKSISLVRGRLMYQLTFVNHLERKFPDIDHPRLSEYEGFVMSRYFRTRLNDLFGLNEIFPATDSDNRLFHFIFLLISRPKSEYILNKLFEKIMTLFNEEEVIDYKMYVIQFGQMIGLPKGQKWVACTSSSKKDRWSCYLTQESISDLPKILAKVSAKDKREAEREAFRTAYKVIREKFSDDEFNRRRQAKWFSDQKLIVSVCQKYDVEYLILKRENNKDTILQGIMKDGKVVTLRSFPQILRQDKYDNLLEQCM